jgi:hypothetical protein
MGIEEIRDWSTATPNHVPIMIMVETKAQSVPDDVRGDATLNEAVPTSTVDPCSRTPRWESRMQRRRPRRAVRVRRRSAT